MCQSPRSFPCQPPCLHLRPPTGPSPRTPGPLRAPLRPLGPALPSCRGAETHLACSPGQRGGSGPAPSPRSRAWTPGGAAHDARAPSPLAPPPCRGRLCWCCPGVSSAAPAPFPPQLGRLLPLHSQGQCPLGAGRLERWRVRPPACLPPAETPAAPSHTCSICRPSFSHPPPQAPPPQLPEASQGVPPSLLLPPPHRSLPAAAPARGIRLSMVAGDRCLPSPSCSPSTGCPPGAKPPPPDPRSLGSSTQFALCTNHICHL